MATEKTSTISKMEAVRKALAGLGKNATPVKIIDYIKTNFGVDMTTGHVSNYKSAILRAKTPKKAESPTPLSAPLTVAPAPAVAIAPKTLNGDGVSLEDVQTVKLLIGRVGEGNLKSLIELLG